MKISSVKSSESKLKALEESIIGLGREDYPFRHKDYELNTCVPCTDFSNWIIDRLEENDIWAIKLLEWEISKDSGIMVGSSNADNESNPKSKELNVYFWSSCVGVDHQLSKNVKKFIITSSDVLREIYCLLIRSKVSQETAYGYFYDSNEYAYNYRFNTYN